MPSVKSRGFVVWSAAVAVWIGAAGCSSSEPVDSVGLSDEPSTESEAEGASPVTVGSSPEPVGGGGFGTIIIDGITYSFSADVCLSEGTFLQVSGPGMRDDSIPYYGSISVNADVDYDDDGDAEREGSVNLDFGTDDAMTDGADDMASYEATLLEGAGFDISDFDYAILDDGTIIGAGEISDTNGVQTSFGELVSFDFAAGCL